MARRIEWGAWAAFGLLLPITSLPLVVRLSGADMVSPAVGLLLPLLFLISLLPRWWRGGRLPQAGLPLLAFASAALLSSGAAFFLDIPPFREQVIWKSELKAVVTLLIGLAFYFSVAGWAGDEARAAHLLRWINWGGALTVGWTLAQGAAWRLLGGYPDWMQQAHALISIRELFPARATGLAYEPSWLAHQLNMLYLPFWAASALSGTSVHRLRWGFITGERLLFVGGLLALVLSVSRVGLLAPLMCILLLVAWGAWRLAGWLQRNLMARSRLSGLRRALLNALVWAGIACVFLFAAGGMFLGAGYALSRYDPRMASLFDLKTLRTGSFVAYANQLVFAERIIFWEAGWNIFNDHPILGVGLGNSGYFFPDKLSSFSWGLTEVRTLMYQWDSLANSKNLWVRLLAETGVLGAGLFCSYLFVVACSALALLKRRGLDAAVGLAGLFVLVGLISEGFSLDTFALPYFWVSFALVTALAARAPRIGSEAQHPTEAVPPLA